MALKLRGQPTADEQIDLREDRRRSVYLGEGIHCSIQRGSEQYKLEIIDISPFGLAFVCRGAKPGLKLRPNERVELEFEKKQGRFTVRGEITGISEMLIQGSPRQRFGLRFDLNHWPSYQAFDEGLNRKAYLAKTYIRPQLSCQDAFFFNELVLFQINSFAADGIDVVTSSRWKSIVPGQILELELYVPGFGTFQVRCRNSSHLFRSSRLNRTRLFFEYDQRNIAMERAIAEYLLIMNGDTSPRKLREAGFDVPHLDQSCQFEYPVKLAAELHPTEYSSSALAIPDFARHGSASDYLSKSRKVVGKVGPHPVVYFRLVFFEQGNRTSELASLGHQISAAYLDASRLELAQVFISNEVLLTDVFVPMLKHIVRIAAQSRSKYLLIDCKPMMRKVLVSLGFTQISKKIARPDEFGEPQDLVVMALEVNAILTNKMFILDTKVWKHFYKELSEFLGRRPPPQKSVMPFHFK